jgi:hypothetical protein
MSTNSFLKQFAQAVQSPNFSLLIEWRRGSFWSAVFLERSQFWSAPTCRRFSLMRPVADVVEVSLWKKRGVKPPLTKALTGQRTPK